jgi:hypothetical protein
LIHSAGIFLKKKRIFFILWERIFYINLKIFFFQKLARAMY